MVRILSTEHKKKISDTLKKKNVPSRFIKGVVFTEDQIKKRSSKMRGHKHNLGKHHSAATRLKMSEVKKGNPLSEEHKQALKGRISPRKGVVLSQMTKRKISENKKRTSPRGENHPHWKGGKSFEPYTTDWTLTLKRAIRERDGYICAICNQHGDNVHHIDYDKMNCNPNNLITLCRRCHTKTNHNREQWIDYFTNYLRSIK